MTQKLSGQIKLQLEFRGQPGLYLLLFALVLGSASCSYSFRKNEVSFADIRTQSDRDTRVFIPIPENLTTRTGPELAIVRALRERFSGIRGVEIVGRPEEADVFLLGRIKSIKLVQSGAPILGTGDSAAAGGISAGQAFSTAYAVSLALDVELVELVQRGQLNGPKRTLWLKSFRKESAYPASGRTLVSGNRIDAGSASAAHINESREKIFWEVMADELTVQILDQVAQEF